MTTPADEGVLGKLHAAIAASLIEKIKGVEVVNEDGSITTQRASAAELAVAVAFLKNNNITCAPAESSALGELQRRMDERRAKRAPALPDIHAEMPADMH